MEKQVGNQLWLLSERELELYKRLPKAERMRINRTKMFCKRCERVCSINASGVCQDCRRITCTRCGKSILVRSATSKVCASCIGDLRRADDGALFNA